MSLINQMLRDLQQRKESGAQTKPDPLRIKKMKRIPLLPLPLVLGGVAILLLCLTWWVAGVLSEMNFGFEALPEPHKSKQIVSIEKPVIAEAPVVVTLEQDQLTKAEREVEMPAAPLVIAPQPEKTVAPVKAQPAQTTAVSKTSVVKPVAIKAAPALTNPSHLAVPRHKPSPVAPLTNNVPPQIQSRPAQPSRELVAKTPERLHPDKLPGAILSRNPGSSSSLSETEHIARPSRSGATTPYGLAEEAYLDGKWAFEQSRDNLAVSSLQQALEIYPGHLPARELLVENYVKNGKTGEAMSLLAEGLEIAPDYIVFKKRYARLLIAESDYAGATKVLLRDGLPSVEDEPEAYVLLASLYQRLDESFLSAQTYRNLLVFWPQTGAFWVGLGEALEGQNLPEEAVECYQRALKTKNLRQDLSLYANKRLNLLN